MTYRIKAHPTRYRDIEFRSRLEATWAAFFDQLGWAWDYEPFDLQGGVPDFVIRGAYRRVLVEVKPTLEMALGALPKALAAAPGECVAVVESGLIDRGLMARYGIASCIGIVSAPYQPAPEKGQHWSLSHNEALGIYDTHIDGDRYLGFYSGLSTKHFEEGERTDFFSPFVDLRPLWAKASNITRWNPGQ